MGSPVIHVFENIQANHSIEFIAEPDVVEPVTYLITATAGVGCSVVPGGVIPVLEGSSLEVVGTPDPGFHISKIIVDGVEVPV